MSNDAQKISLLDASEYLYLRKLSEPVDNSLIIVVEQAVGGRAQSDTALLKESPGLAGLLKGARAIETMAGCMRFQLHWKRYVAYLVTEEAAGSCGKYTDEKYTGRFF